MATQADIALQALGNTIPATPQGTQADAALAAISASNGSASGSSWLDSIPDNANNPLLSPREWLRQLALTGRHTVTGITGLPAVIGNGVNGSINLGINGVNSLLGTDVKPLQMPSQIIQNTLDSAGAPQPKNMQERLVGAGTAGMAGVTPATVAGTIATRSVDPSVRAIGNALLTAPGNQVIASGSEAAGGQGNAEAGGGPLTQLAASLLAGGAGVVGASGAAGTARMVGRALAPEFTETVAPGSVPQPLPQAASSAVENSIGDSPLPPLTQEATDALNQRTAANLSNNPGSNPQAAARAADARALGMKLTLGQVSRDPSIYADEQNLLPLEAAKPLVANISSQNRQLAQALESTTGTGGTPYQAGKIVMPTLQNLDESMRQQVSAAYKAASQSTDATLDIPLQGVAQDYAQVLHDFADKVPKGVQNTFDDYGLISGTQKKTFTVDDAENVLKNINANRSNDPATNLALTRLSQSVKNAILSADDKGGVFAVPRQMAAQRFALHEAIPALDDAVTHPLNSQGYNPGLSFEDFANKHIINGNVDTVGALVDFLKNKSPAAVQEIQGQVGNKLRDSAFGPNLSGDTQFRPAMFANALTKQLGPDFLSRIYSPESVDQLYTIGRTASNIFTHPSGAPVNTSRSGGVAVQLASKIPFVGEIIGNQATKARVAQLLAGKLSDTASLPGDQPPPLTQQGLQSVYNASRP